jgi:ribokinase
MVPAFRADKIVDTTAEGDAFTAALTIEYLKTGDIIKAVKFGCAAGAVTVSRAGAGVSIPSEDEVRKFLESRNIFF